VILVGHLTETFQHISIKFVVNVMVYFGYLGAHAKFKNPTKTQREEKYQK
jgi:hypothetical protein